jgi:hypothetical protein
MDPVVQGIRILHKFIHHLGDIEVKDCSNAALTSISTPGLEALSETTVVGFAADRYCTWYPGGPSR